MHINDFIGLIGFTSLSTAFVLCVGIIITMAIAHFHPKNWWNRLAAQLTHSQTIMLAVSVLALGILLQSSAYEYTLVFNAVENLMPWYFRLGGLWSGQASSLLFWSLVLSCAMSIAITIAKKSKIPGQLPTILLVLAFTLVFFLVPDVFIENPFEKSWLLPSGIITNSFFPPLDASLIVPVDGQGMQPSLRDPAMLLHPPTLYLGLVGFFLPYVFLLSGLFHHQIPEQLFTRLQPWALFAWICLTLGMFLGSWWAYTILGWGGYWGWDAVEISGLLPWMLSFGLLHCLSKPTPSQRKWGLFFSFSIVLLTLLGILITRSGILDSVHAYTSGTMGLMLTVLIGLHGSAMLVASLRASKFPTNPQKLSKNAFPVYIMHAFHLLLTVTTVIYLFGQTLPLTSRFFGGQSTAFQAQDYERYSSVFLLLIMAATGLHPLTIFWKNGKRFKPLLAIMPAIAALLLSTVLYWRHPFHSFVFLGFTTTFFSLITWIMAGWHLIVTKRRLKKGTGFSLRRIGSVFIHIGFSLMAVGILGVENLALKETFTLSPNTPITIGGYKIKENARDLSGMESVDAAFSMDAEATMPNGKTLRLMPNVIFYPKLNGIYPIPAIDSNMYRDVQLLISGFPTSGTQPIEVTLHEFPLMLWIWIGGTVMVLGGTLSLLEKNKSRD